MPIELRQLKLDKQPKAVQAIGGQQVVVTKVVLQYRDKKLGWVDVPTVRESDLE